MENTTSVSRGSGMLSVSTNSASSLTLTPGRTRNIAQDMEAIRLSRQDNPFLQQVMASRESLIESHHEENDSDDAILMAQEFCSSSIDLLAENPVTLKQLHDHMIRSPPPISYWPHGDFRTNVRNNNSSIRTRSSSRPISPKPKDNNIMRPLSLPGESHLKNALGRSSRQTPHDRFSILHNPVPIRRTVQESEDSVHLVQDSDK